MIFKRGKREPALVLSIVAMLFIASSPVHAFTSSRKVAFSMVAQTGGGVTSSTLTITAQPLSAQAFYGKNVVIPVTVTTDSQPIRTDGLTVVMGYQLVGADGVPIGSVLTTPVTASIDQDHGNILRGAAILSRNALTPIRHGGKLQYFFRTEQAGTATTLQRTGLSRAPVSQGQAAAADSPFEVAMIDSLSAAVGPQGSQVSVPDTYASDGQTTVAFDPGALSGPGTLTIHQEDPDQFPVGPRNQKATVVYSLSLQNTELRKFARLTLSYPSEINGSVTGSGAQPSDLAPFFKDGDRWTLLSRPQLDSTMHTVSAITTHFSTFALFASGPLGSSAERPAQRIITPNGDGINDYAQFANADGEDVQIFDVRGRRIKKLNGPSSKWDATDDDGKIVESGVYIYQFKSQGDRISGVIYVAK